LARMHYAHLKIT